MGDLLVSGAPDRPPRFSIRLVVGGLTLLAVGVLVALPLLDSGSPTEPGPRPPATTPSASTSPATPPPLLPDEQVQARLDGSPGDLPSGVVLALGGPEPTAVGRGSGPAFALDQLPLADGEAVSALLPASGGLVAVVQHAVLSDTEPAARVYLVGAGGPVLLAEADEVVVGHRRDRVFALRYGPGWTSPGTLLQVSWSGRVVAGHSTPVGFALHADTPAGLLTSIRPLGDEPARLQLVDPLTLAVREQLGPIGYVLTATATRAVWLPHSCAGPCGLAVADLTTGARSTVRLATGFDPGSAAISPDGRHLAVGYRGRHPQQPGGAAAGFVEVVTLPTGRVSRIPGVATGIKQVAELAWTPDGKSLALTVGQPEDDRRRVGLWAPGGPVRVLPADVAGAGAPSALLALSVGG